MPDANAHRHPSWTSRNGRKARKGLEGSISLRFSVAPAGRSSAPGGVMAGPWRTLREEIQLRIRLRLQLAAQPLALTPSRLALTSTAAIKRAVSRRKAPSGSRFPGPQAAASSKSMRPSDASVSFPPSRPISAVSTRPPTGSFFFSICFHTASANMSAGSCGGRCLKTGGSVRRPACFSTLLMASHCTSTSSEVFR